MDLGVFGFSVIGLRAGLSLVVVGGVRTSEEVVVMILQSEGLLLGGEDFQRVCFHRDTKRGSEYGKNR